MNKLIVLNHKNNLLYDDLYPYIENTNNINTNNNIIICPSNIYLESFINNSNWAIGAQNLNHNLDSNHTGEISTLQLKSLGVEYTIIGHSERVSEFQEDEHLINLKLKAALDSNIIPILCLGEDKEAEFTKTIAKQLETYLKDIDHLEFVILAYEPVYAIGNKAIDSYVLEERLDYITKLITDKYHEKPTIIYGGGVNKDNIKEIMNLDNISGVMIGAESTTCENIKEIVNNLG